MVSTGQQRSGAEPNLDILRSGEPPVTVEENNVKTQSLNYSCPTTPQLELKLLLYHRLLRKLYINIAATNTANSTQCTSYTTSD